MSAHSAIIAWSRNGESFTDNRYSRLHLWTFDGGATVPASASPHVVPLPLSNAEAVDPEEAFIAALSSCHMLWFLSIVAKQGYTVNSYVDKATGKLEADGNGKLALLKVVLRPHVSFSGKAPSSDVLVELHEKAHSECFLANSVKTTIRIEPTAELDH